MNDTFDLRLSPQDLGATIVSHGWYKLEPFHAAVSPPALTVPFDLPAGAGVVAIGVADGRTVVTCAAGDPAACRQVASTCLSLDQDVSRLHREADRSPEWRWISHGRMGRFLRSPSLFEDCCKIIFAMNTTFARTVAMTELTVRQYGRTIGGLRAFPTPAALLDAGADRLRADIRCGFRARYLLSLAEAAVQRPQIFLAQGWRSLTPADFAQALSGVAGMGPVSVDYIARMYGKPQGYAVDSYVKRRCAELWGVPAGDILPFVQHRYAALTPYGPLVFWLELTRHWHGETRDEKQQAS